MDSAKSKIIIIIISLFFHIAVLYDYWFGDLLGSHPVYWAYQYSFLVGVMICLTIPLPFIKNPRQLWLLLLARVVLTMIAAIPFAAQPGNFSLLYALLIFEGFIYLPKFVAITLGLLLLFFSGWMAQQHVLLWSSSFRPSGANVNALIATWAQCLLSGLIGYYLADEQQLRMKEKTVLAELRQTNEYFAETVINLQNTAAQAELRSMYNERNRIAREIHDSLAYALTNLLAMLNVYRAKLLDAGAEVPEEISEARTLAHEGLQDVRQVLRTLRPREKYNYDGLGCINRLVKMFSKATGIQVTLSYGDVPQFVGEDLEAVCYRLVQEGLTNSFRHGKASEVWVFFHLVAAGIELVIKDNGCGTSNPTGGYGLIGINERVTELGGTVKVSSQPGYGFTLQLSLPYQKEED